MRPEELEAVCRQAAADLLGREGRPLPPAVVLPLPEATKVTLLPDLPDDDLARAAYLARFAEDVMGPANAPCYGFVAEAEAVGGEVVIAVFGARGHAPRITAAHITEGGTEGERSEPGEWLAAEELDPEALPFLRALQAAAEASDPNRPVGGGGLPGWPGA